MMTKKISLRLRSIKWHGLLGWVAGAALILWAASGLTHVAMSAFGPQQAIFRLPDPPLDLSGVQALDQTFAAAGITAAQAVRVLPGIGRPVLQVTETADAPRRYFLPETGEELVGYDKALARHLARVWLGGIPDRIANITLLTGFSDEYPPVNRLLPVWRVEFARADRLTAYIHTETRALAAVTDNPKRALQAVFQNLHTLDWLPRAAEPVRVALITLAMACLFGIAATGVAMLALIRRKARAPGLRGWHRLAGYVLALPILGYSASGFYHLATYAGDAGGRILMLAPPLDLTAANWPIHTDWQALTDGLPVTGLSLVAAPDGRPLYRLALAGTAAINGADAIRNARFDGVQPSGPAVYLDAETGQVWEGGDRALALHLASQIAGAPPRSLNLVTRFGPGYDFRNKRLPVWKAEYPGEAIFVDTAIGALVDRQSAAKATEGQVFSSVHKWGFLRPLGRDAQNLIIAGVGLAMIGFAGAMGLALAVKRARRLRPVGGPKRAAAGLSTRPAPR